VINTIIRNLALNEAGEREQGRQLKATTPADRYSKVGVSEAGCPVRFINAGNLGILGCLFFWRSKGRSGKRRGGRSVRNVERSRIVEPAVAKGQRVNSTAEGSKWRSGRSFLQSGQPSSSRTHGGYLY